MLPPILTPELLELMDAHDERGNPVPFSIVAVSANRAKKTGGEILRFDRCILLRNHRLKPVGAVRVVVEKTEAARLPVELQSRVRRLYLVDSRLKRAVNFRLITHFNSRRYDY